MLSFRSVNLDDSNQSSQIMEQKYDIKDHKSHSQSDSKNTKPVIPQSEFRTKGSNNLDDSRPPDKK